MRRVEESKLWTDLNLRLASSLAGSVALKSGNLDLRTACTIIGGLNGSGKSRLLQELRDELDGEALYIDLHRMCEQVRTRYRSIESFEELLPEVQPQVLSELEIEDVQRVIRREYAEISWYALDLGPTDEAAAVDFTWGGDSPTLPYFVVRRGESEYAAPDMGLGELSVHLLFWILSQYRSTGLTVILDEPDAYLPPIGVQTLLDRLLRLCLSRQWKLVVSSHSTEIISRAVTQSAFIRVEASHSKSVESTHCADDDSTTEDLLEDLPVRFFYLVEDESAHALTTELLSRMPQRLGRSATGVWGSGFGYLLKLQKYLPRAPKTPLDIALIFDGDMRTKVKASETNRWPAIFLPTSFDPDTLFKLAGTADVAALAGLLSVAPAVLGRFLEPREAADAHDWVNDLGVRFGRPLALSAMARLWVDQNPDELSLFLTGLHENFGYGRLAP